MPKRLVPLTIGAPGFLGLNTQQEGSILPPGWATVLDNAVYDDVGRIASRNGHKQVNGTVITSTPTVRASHEYIDGSGNVLHIVACDNKIYKQVSGTMTDISGTITTPTADSWQFVNFNGWCVGFQEGHAPIALTTVGGSFADSGGTQYNGVAGLAAYGRLWTVLNNTLYYSDLLINNFTGGSSGTFDLATYWPNGMDEVTAVMDFNGMLLVFGKHSIIVYESPDDVSNMALVESLHSIGCVARDSIQVIGNDLVFLSDGGLRSLNRTIVQGQMPLSDFSKHVRDSLVGDVVAETAVQIKSVYNEEDGFYLLSLPTTGKSYCFDLKFPNEDGSWKTSTWDYGPTALNYSQANTMYLAAEAGYISQYTGWEDGVDSVGAGGSAYNFDYEGVWNDLGDEVGNLIKLPKQVSVLAAGTAGGSVVFKWALDYSSTFKNRLLDFSSNQPARFGTAQFSISTFGSSGDFERVRSNLAGTGQVIKIGILASISESSFAVQRIDVLSKLGKLGL